VRTLLQSGRGVVAALALCLSLVPFALIAPTVLRTFHQFERRHQSEPLVAPAVHFTAEQLARFRVLPASPGAIPVLAYRGIAEKPDGASIDQATFAAQMAMLHRAGFTAITMERYVRFAAGQRDGLPERPVLITFDDGRLDSYRGAEKVLEREDMRATMFVSAGQVEDGKDESLTWRELHTMADSGRWEIQSQGDEGRSVVQYDSTGRPGPFYAFRRWSPKTGTESLADWEQRVAEDIFNGREALRRQGWASPAFALPYGSYGQYGTNDLRIPRLLGELLHRQFGVVFVQGRGNDPEWSMPSPAGGLVERLEVHTPMTADSLYGWLEKHDPAERAARAATAARAAKLRAAKAAARLRATPPKHRRGHHR
jgi:peptidoglycan/xylan/chitin deacetylase (PgdA/CDA1 family)